VPIFVGRPESLVSLVGEEVIWLECVGVAGAPGQISRVDQIFQHRVRA